MAKSPAWTRKEGKNPEGGLNEKGRASLRAAGHDIKRPQPEGGARKDSFCARMKGMKAKLTSSETANDPNSRINKSLRKWNCHADGGAIDIARQYRADGGKTDYDRWKEQVDRANELNDRYAYPEKYNVSPEEYRKGNLGHGKYALSHGGRAGYATGGDPGIPTTNPVVSAQDPNANYVRSLYQNIMGRPGEQAGVDYWTGQLSKGATNPSDIMSQFAASNEFQNLYKANPAQAVSALYQEALGRAPDLSGQQYWQQQAQQGMSLADMVRGFTQSNEGKSVRDINDLYLELTGQVATPEQLKQGLTNLTPQSDYMDFIQKTFPYQESGYGDQYAGGKRTDAGPNVWGQVSAAPVGEQGRAILDLIGAGEGGYDTARVNTGKGVKPNYNYSIGDNPLSNATIADVIKQQGAGNINAVGKYQFIPDVLKEIVRDSGIDPNTKFDAATQDKLALFRAYNYRSRLRDYLEGKSDNLRGAMIDLAKEWRSFPNPATGMSWDAHNRSKHTLAQVKQALMGARGNMWAQPTQFAGMPGGAPVPQDQNLGVTLTNAGAGGNVYTPPPPNPIPGTITNPAPSITPSTLPGGWVPPGPSFQPQPIFLPTPSMYGWDVGNAGIVGSMGGSGSVAGFGGGGGGGAGTGGGSVGGGGFSVGFGPGMASGGAVDIARSYRADGGRNVLSPMERIQGYLKEKFGPREEWQDIRDQLNESGVTSVNPKGQPYTEMVNKYLTLAGMPAIGKPFSYHRLNDLPEGSGKWIQRDNNKWEYTSPNRSMPGTEYPISPRDEQSLIRYERADLQGASPWRTAGEQIDKPVTPMQPANMSVGNVVPAKSTRFMEQPIKVQSGFQSDKVKSLFGDTGVTGKPFVPGERPVASDRIIPGAHTPSSAMIPWDATHWNEFATRNPGHARAVPEREYSSQGSTSALGHVFGTGMVDPNIVDPNELRAKEKLEIENTLRDLRESEPVMPDRSCGGAIDIARAYRKAGGPVWDKPRPKHLGKSQKLSPNEKSSAKAAAKAAGRPYPNLVDNMRAAREEGGRLRPFMEAKIEEIGDTELGKYGIGPNAPASTKDELKAGPEQSTWEKIAAKAMGDRPSPERRRFVEGAGNIADVAHLGSYATPLAPYVGAADFARGVASGDPMEAALGATGLPGRGAKAVGVAASAMMPESAEAGPLAKALNAIRAYHGSPHWFDKFDISKIGTGEGAQAYGHGLYFADKEGVARSYRDAVSNMQEVTPHLKFEGSTIYRGHDLNDLTPAQIAAQSVAELGGIDQSRRTMLDFSKSPYTGKMWSDALAELEANPQRFKDVAWQKPGYMYEVDIHADPSHMLDWDKPLSEQPGMEKRIIDAIGGLEPLRKSVSEYNKKYFSMPIEGRVWDQPGVTFHTLLGDQKVAEPRLKKAGIPGIKYLDQGSRGAGEGTSNYVVFDPNIIEILRRYKDGGYVE